MKNSYLWSQSVSVDDKDYCIINDSVSFYEGSIPQDDAMRIINSTNFKPKTSHNENENTSPAFQLKQWGRWIYISGNFQEVDSAGRKRLYVYVTEHSDVKTALDTLKKYASLIHCSLWHSDLLSVEKYFSHKKKISILLISLIIALCLIIPICRKLFM